MVARVNSTLPRAMCTSRARDFHVRRSFLVCVLSLWLTLSVAHALDPNKRLTQYAHTAWRIQDGFLPNTPFWISQTKDGYLWVGGVSGAFRFDGVRFTPWSAPIASTPVGHPVSVQAGEFWVTSLSELFHVRNNVVVSHYDVQVSNIYKDSDGSVWVLSYVSPDRVLCQATDAKIRCFGKAEGINVHMPSSLLPDGKGGFWIGGDTSLLHWKMGAAPEPYNFQQLQSNVGQIGIHSLLQDSDGSLLVGIESAGPGLGLERFRNGVLTPVVLPNFDGSKLAICELMEDSHKNLWIATYGNGIYRIHGQTVDHFGRADGLSNDTVIDLYETDDGVVWVATSEGIDNFRDLPVTTFSASEGLGRDGAGSVMAAKDGTIWVANLGTLDFIRNGAVSSVRVPGQQVSSLFEDNQGNIWVGVDDGLFIYKGGRFRRIPEPDHHPLGLVLGMTEDVDGNIWAECKSRPRRLIRIHDFKVREQFFEPEVTQAKAIAADPRGGIWLGTLNGDLTFFRDGLARTSPLNLKGKSWIDKMADQIAVDPDGSVITASHNGLVMLRAGKVQRLGKENGLPCDGVGGFAVDDDKNLWLNTPCGFIEIAAADVQRWRTRPDTIVQTRLFDTLDGARPGRASFNPAAKSPDGRLWFVNGVVLQMIDPSHLSGDGTISPVYVETVVADRKEYKPQEGLQLPPLTRDLQIAYTSPGFLIPQKVEFRYRLDGFDRDWRDAGTRREAFYTELRPGKYQFHVIASDSSGVWNQQGATLDFVIAPAYYQTNWFRLSCVAIFVALLWTLHRWRVHQLTGQEKHLRDVVETIPAMTFTALSDGSATFVNKRWTEYTGLSVEQSFGTGWQSVIHVEDLARNAEKWRISVATGQLFEDEARFRCAADGEYRWFLVRGVPLRDQNGKIIRWYGTLTDIEDRKRAEEAFQQNQLYLAEGQRLAHMGSWAFDAAGFSYWSSELFRIYGLDPVGNPPTIEEYLALAHPEDRVFMKQAIAKMLDDHLAFDFTKRIVRPEGEIRHVRCVGVPLTQAGVFQGFLGTGMDVTQQERLTEELRLSEQYLSEGQRLAHMGSWAFNPSGFFDYWSHELFQIYGLDPLKGAPTLEEYLATIHPQDRDFMVNTIKRMCAERVGCDEKKRIVRPDGELRYIRCVGIPVIKAEALIGFIGTAMDVTEEEQLTRELEQRQAYLALAQRLSHTGSFGWQVSTGAIYWSDETFRIFGMDPATRPSIELIRQRTHPDDRQLLRQTMDSAALSKSDIDLEHRLTMPNGSVKFLRVLGHPSNDGSGNLEYRGVVTDITDHKRAEQEREKLRLLEDDLAHINRVSMLGEMAASLAHEIKQPIAAAITSANSCIEWLAHDPPNIERARATATRIDRYGRRAAEIIDRIRSFYRKSHSERELVEVNGIIDEMLALLQGEATRFSIEMRTELAPELPKIMADRIQLQQVFMNLMLNAIEAMNESGGELTVRSQLHDGQLLFSVGDTGPGLPPGSADQIFSAFFTTKPQGSGMGLAISRTIVESHGGRLWPTANDGRGTTFHFSLPTEVQ
jgi:PAS domain S-box-containing protein